MRRALGVLAQPGRQPGGAFESGSFEQLYVLLIQPRVLEPPAVEDAVVHDRYVLDSRIPAGAEAVVVDHRPGRSEERRVGKECRDRWWGYEEKKKREERGEECER